MVRYLVHVYQFNEADKLFSTESEASAIGLMIDLCENNASAYYGEVLDIQKDHYDPVSTYSKVSWLDGKD